GAVIFNDEGVVDSREWRLRFDHMLGHIDPATVAWWMEQSKEAQQITFGGDRVQPYAAAYELKGMIDKHQPVAVWSNDPHFDFIILRNWWERYRKPGPPDQPTIAHKWPFAYNTPRSYRTL